MASEKDQTVVVPLKLDAFIFNAKVCDGIGKEAEHKDEELYNNGKDTIKPPGAKIAPIVQPNYTFLRLDTRYIQNDITNTIDLHNSWPHAFNSRFTDLGSDEARERRQGVYLHWTLPRLYRSGIAAATKRPTPTPKHDPSLENLDQSKSTSELTRMMKDEEYETAMKSIKKGRAARGLHRSSADDGGKVDPTAPAFPSVPTRWLVIRYIQDQSTIKPPKACTKVRQFTGWVVESDRQWALDELDESIDLQVDVSPFISAKPKSRDQESPDKPPKGADVSLKAQAEVFIGKKTCVEEWKEDLKVPRIPKFGLLASSNQLFADYQPHCSNVFSMVDNFKYGTVDDGKGKRQSLYLDEVQADYYVVGYHSVEEDDIFNGTDQMSRRERLANLKLAIKLDAEKPKKDRRDPEIVFKDWLDASNGTHTVCHAAMYGVKWTRTGKPKVPADDFSAQLNNNLPISVGTTPMDALLTYAHAHAESQPGEQPLDPPDLAAIENLILDLETFLIARDDGVEAKQQAVDTLYNWNYMRSDGGLSWNISGQNDTRKTKTKTSQPGVPPAELIPTLRTLNSDQQRLDGMHRMQKHLRWELFSEWWKLVTDSTPDEKREKREEATKKRVEILVDRIMMLNTKAATLKTEIGKQSEPSHFQSGTKPPFYQQRDPTLLVGGIKSGWQHDYLDDLQIRLESQVIQPTKEETPSLPKWEGFDKLLLQFLKPVRPVMEKLVTEFLCLSPERFKTPKLSDVMETPLFHDQLNSDSPKELAKMTNDNKLLPPAPLWRDRWENTQPWFPLFLEWEVEYFHIPYHLWSLETRGSRSSRADQLRYGIPSSNNLENLVGLKDKRTVAGRVLILPQAGFSLEAKIRQLFSETPSSELNKDGCKGGKFPDEKTRNQLERDLRKLAFLSAPLAGLTAELTTIAQGSHIKPNLRDPQTGLLMPITEAKREKGGFGPNAISQMDLETDNTPFGSTVKSPEKDSPPMFKPATHGQFRFTRLNIIDKFGQAIHAIDPTPRVDQQHIWPCIGEWYAPQLIDKVSRDPNVVAPAPKPKLQAGLLSSLATDDCPTTPRPPPPAPPKLCEFVQIPPQINQLARLNSAFVVRDTATDKEAPFWKPADEWENPIWGWIVINYANLGIQLFLQDGTFYREVRLAGRDGSQTSPEWLPFEPPKDPSQLYDTPEFRQLQLLVNRLGDRIFLEAFWDMIVDATGSMQTTPDAYAGFANALIGRPLALTNVGWSLELEGDALVSQLEADNPPLWALKPPPKDPARHPTKMEPPPPEIYKFPVKLGDNQRGFDGLVGFFPCRDKLDGKKGTTGDLGLELNSIYTYFQERPKENSKTRANGVKDTVEANRRPVDKSTAEPPVKTPPHVNLPSFWVSPEGSVTSDQYAWRRNRELQVFGMLLDPFAPLHSYSAILPIRELSLPPWTWQGAMATMRAFFHSGPVIVTRNVPDFKEGRQLIPQNPILLPDVQKGEGTVGVAAAAGGQWAWLQPYEPEDKKLNTPELFMPLAIAVNDERARYEPGPYTALEGYVMMVDPKEKDEKT